MGAADERLRRLVDRQQPRLRRLLLRVLADLPGRLVGPLTDALEARDLEAVLRLVAADLTVAQQPIVEALRDVMLAGAGVTGAQFGLRFDVTDPLMVRAAETQAARLVSGVGEESRRAIREIVTLGFTEGRPPREQARHILRLVGLTERDAGAVDRMWRRMLEDGVRQADSRAETYAARLLRRRAENIARTETIRAASEGKRAGWRKAVEEGYLEAGVAEIVWLVTDDDRLCSLCAPMAGQTVGVVGDFTSDQEATGDLASNPGGIRPYAGDTRPIEAQTVGGPPLHPSCRCDLTLRVR